MNEIVMRLKSGREFRFKCEEYTIKTFKPTGTLSEFSYKGGVGECPIYFQELDIECIAIIEREQAEALDQEPKMVHRETLEQVMWERDIAIEQLKELGYGLGEKIAEQEPIIRCEECKHHGTSNCQMWGDDTTEDYMWCCDGERKENNEE